MKFAEIATSPFFENSNEYTYAQDGWIEFYPVSELGPLTIEMTVKANGTEYPALAVSHSTDPDNWREGRVIVEVNRGDGGYVEFTLDDNIVFNVYSRNLEVVL